MHHLYPAAKGDPLCPLGFHPQVRWPTRCKRCFRDYKEHGGRIKESEPLRRDDVASSSPSLSNWSSSSSRSRDDSQSSTDSGLSSRSSWAGSDESAHSSSSGSSRFGTTGRPAMSWTSTPDLGKLADDTKAEVTTVSFTLPRRRPPTTDTGQDTSTSETFTLRRRSTTPSRGDSSESTTTSTSKPSQERTRQRLLNSSQPASNDAGRLRRVKIQSLKEVHSVEEPTNPEVEFVIKVKPPKEKDKPQAFSTNSSNSIKKPVTVSSSSSSSSGTSEEESEEESDDSTSIAGTETTETTLVDRNENELQEQIESLKQELEMMRSRCERVEREKSDLLLRRIAAIDMPPSKTAASEVLKLQQRVNDLQSQVEDYRDEKKSLSLRVKELEEELEARPDKNVTLKTIDDLRSKLLAAETLCEELMDENEDMKKELRDLEEEIEEMQDNFREDQADEYSSLKKELEQTAKNCRILSFKLRKAERKTEQLEAEKLEAEKKLRELAGGQSGLEKAEKISKLEEDLKFANEFAEKLKKELDDTREKLKAKEEASNKELLQNKKKAPKLGTLPSGEKMSRESLTRGGSQDDPVQLLRDLEGAMEREADLREQLRFAEEEKMRRTRIIIKEKGAEIEKKDIAIQTTEGDRKHLVLPASKKRPLRVISHSGSQPTAADIEDASSVKGEDTDVVCKTTRTECRQYSSLGTQISVMCSETATQTVPKAVQVDVGTQISVMCSETATQTVPKAVQVDVGTQISVMCSETATQTVPKAVQVDVGTQISVMCSETATQTVPKAVQLDVGSQTVFRSRAECVQTEKIPHSSVSTETTLEMSSTEVQTETQPSEMHELNSHLPDVIAFETRPRTFHQSASHMRQVQFSMSTMFPPGALLASSSPMSMLMTSIGRRHSPSPARLTPEPPNERDEGISDEEDPAELRLLLELNEQETGVLRRKTEELEKEGDALKKKVKELQEKLNVKTARKNVVSGLASSEAPKGNAVHEQKLKVLEEEVSELRKKLIDKERDCERLHAELTLTQKRFSKGTLQKSKSLDSGSEQQALDLKRQLQTIEQEAAILRTRTQALETENEKLNAENKKLQLLRISKKSTPAAVDSETENSMELREKITALEAQLSDSNQKVAELQAKLEAEEASDSKKKGVAAKEPDVSKLKKDLKSKTDELEKLKTQMTKAESEKEKLDQVVKRLKKESIADALKFYKQRTPKKPTEFTTKLQMKKMVEDLENEIGEVLVVLKKSEAEKTKLGSTDSAGKDTKVDKTLEESKKKIEDLEKELKEEKEKAEKERKKTAKEKKIIEEGKKKAEEEKHRLEEEKKSWDDQKKKLEETKRMLEEEKKKTQEEKDKLAEEIVKLTAEKAAATVKQDELAVFIQRIETLKKELEDEKNAGVELRRKLELAQKAEQEKTRLQKENADKTSKLSDVEKKAKEAEDKLKKTEKMLTTNKNKVAKLEKELEEERERARTNEATQQGVAASWLAERDSLKDQLTTLQNQCDNLEATLAGKAALIEQLEANVKEEREKATDASTKASMAERKEISKLKDELAANKGQVQELTQKLEKAEKNYKGSEEKLKKLEAELKKEKTELEKKASELENDISAERKKTERMKITHEKELKNRDQELSTLRSKIRSLESNTGVNSKKINEVKQEYEAKIDKLEEELSTERQEYEDLTAKYEILEEEHVVTKAQLVMEKETVQNQLQVTKRELASAETELRTLRETYNSKQDAWIKEKLDQQEKLKELEEKVTRNGSDAWNLERNRLKASIEEKNHEIEQLKREADVLNDQSDHIRKENDELRRKLEDFDKVVKIQRNMSADTTALERQLRESKNMLTQEEKNHKAEMAQLKMRYDSQVAVVSDEIQALQAQVTRFKRERDTFRHMLEGAQKTITELKSKPKPSKDSRTSSSGDESEETQLKIASLEQQVSCMEDELSEARLESSKLKTELISERSSWEVKMSEMQSRINELEEEKILTSGRTKIPGMRTRMELAWQKEREEQHRLLQETSTLARDLRQTLFEVERERDKERLESKRRLDQLKKSTEEEQEETRKKVSELQCDLLELRDAHAKLRTTNEKLRREKERYEKEREELRQMVTGRKRAEQEEERKVNALLEQVDELMRLAPELMSQKQKAKSPPPGQAPTPPVRLKGPKSRESSREASPALERKFTKESSVDRKAQLQTTVQRLNAVTEELRKYQKQNEEERDRERARRTIGMRRAASTESENPPDVSSRPKAGAAPKGSLYRKSLSLEQTGGQEQSIWKIDDENDGSMSSLQSMESGDSRFFSLHRRETSMDSRLSGGSTQSEVVQSSGDKKKKKGILGKLKKLTKSRSIDETTSGVDYSATSSAQGSNLGGSGSDISMGGEEKGSKKDLREKFTGIFKKSGSRSGSLERGVKPPKEQSPALPERGESKKTSTLPRPSPARSDSSHTSSVSRPLTASSVSRPLTPLKSPASAPTKPGQSKAK